MNSSVSYIRSKKNKPLGPDPSQDPENCECPDKSNTSSLLRSCPMTYCDIYIQPEAAFEILSRLGEMCCVQFVDMKPDMQSFLRNYISEVCRCDEMERKLRFIESEMVKDNIYLPYPAVTPKAIHPNEMIAYENLFDKWQADITDMSKYQSNLQKDLYEIKEIFYLLSNIGPLFGDAEVRKESKLSWSGGGDIGPGGRLIIFTGVIKRNLALPFEMMLWRISHGNIYFRLAAQDQLLHDPMTGTEVRKVGFLAVCQGEELGKRMEKIAAGFRVNLYPCPQGLDERDDMITKIEDRIWDLEEVVAKTKYHRCKSLRAVGRQWRIWMIQVRKTKAIYYNLNLFNLDITKKCLIGQCWVPDQYLGRVQDTLAYCTQLVDTAVPSFMSKINSDSLEPPTYHRTNKFTNGFQVLIDAYGDSRYREINPSIFTIVTFPFLFSLMFGDVCHAIILFSFGLWMVINEEKYTAQHSENEIWNIFFHGRYVILLMGLFSIYSGFIYNDFFSKCIALVTPMWMTKELAKNIDLTLVTQHPVIEIDAAGFLGKPYLFSIDPMWTMARNKIVFENSIKMKASIIIGVLHMMFGILLSFFNYRYFKNYASIFLRFIPEILFLACIFLWLVFMMFYKWFNYSAQFKDVPHGSACAPPLLILFINMILVKETVPEDDACEGYMFDSQREIQFVLLAIAGLCIPVMLFGTPLAITYKARKARQRVSGKQSFNRHNVEKMENSEKIVHETPFSDLMINQGVHTIEFVLSTISHTASYLRLWALSLAHSQLSEMLWTMVLSKLALRDHTRIGALKLFVIFAIWAAFTVSILVVMEGLSAFLHTLRLHWVEFMSKFFYGGGYPFRPFCFKTILASDEKPEAACKPKKRTKKKHREQLKSMNIIA